MSAGENYDLNPPRRGLHRDTDAHIGFEEDGDRSVPVRREEFAYPDSDGKPGIKEPGEDGFDKYAEREVFMLFGMLWAEVLEWIYVPKNSRLIGMRLKAVIYCCRPELMAERSMRTIAARDGVTKQTFCELVRQFREEFNVACRSMRTDLARNNMREAALKIHALKGKPKKSPHPPKESFFSR